VTALKLLFASDLHFSADLREEMSAAGPLLPADTYDHLQDGHLVWHNTMLVEQTSRMFDALESVMRRESPDLTIFAGDLVNTNWAPNVAAVASRVSALPGPTRLVTGNHDIYLGGSECRLQEHSKPGEYATGMRHEWVNDIGLIYLDLFVQQTNGTVAKATDPCDAGAAACYRAQDIAETIALLDGLPDRRFLVIGHFPMIAPDERLRAPGRKIGWHWPSASALAPRLSQPGNLLGVVCGHQHFAHWQPCAYAFHWTLPALVEYPCAAAVLTIGKSECRGRLVVPDEALSELSFSRTRVQWPAGEPSDREFGWPI